MSKILSLVLTLLVVLTLIFTSCSSGATATKTITNTKTETIDQTTTHEELSTSEIVSRISPAVAHILGDYGAGTGIVIDSRGYILTNNHVVEGEDNLIVRLPDREQVIAEVVYQDPGLDIAIIKCFGTGYPYVPLGSIEELSLGDDVVVIGYPLGSLLGDSASMSKGIVSAFRSIDDVSYIQTDAPANPGSSGGPLVNTYGEVIGIVSWGLAETEGMNFAIEVNNIKTYIEDILQLLIEGGISITTVTQTITHTVTADGVTSTVIQILEVTKFVCPVCGTEFDTFSELKAHFDAEHAASIPTTVTITAAPTTTVTVTTTVTEAPPTTTPPLTTTTSTPNIIFTFTGVGERNTPPFSISTSPWILRYTANWSGTFIVYLKGDSSGTMIALGVTSDEVYETYIYDKTGGTLYFKIASAPSDGEWTITVIELS